MNLLKRKKPDLKNIKEHLDSYEELINDNPEGISYIIITEIREKIGLISGYYSKLNNNYKKKFKNIVKFLENQTD